MMVALAIGLLLVFATGIPLWVFWPVFALKWTAIINGQRVRLFSSVTGVSTFLGRPDGAPPVTFIYEGVCVSADRAAVPLTGASVDVALVPHDFARRVRSLNIAAFEALEREAARRSVVPIMNVRSNGVAIQRSRWRAVEASRRELAERDVVLLHTYCHVPPASRFRFSGKSGLYGETAEDIRILSALSQELDELSVFLLQSVYSELDVIVAVVRNGAQVGIGFGAGAPRQTRTLTKAVMEALCIAKAFAVPTTAAVLAEARACGFRDETVETFAARAEALGVPAAELQCGILLAELERGDCLRFLYDAPVAPSVEALLTSRTPCLDETGTPVRPATIETTPIASMLGGLLHVCQATSANAFLLGWPSVPLAEIKRVATLRRVASRLGENARLPCIVA